MAAYRSGVSPAILLFLACSFWGIATVLIKSLLLTIPPVPLLLIQLLASSIFLWIACLSLGKSLPSGKTLAAAIALGVLNPGISYTFSMLGLERISASVSSLLWATEPFLILGLAWLVLKEPITPRVLAVIACGFAGVLLVSELFAGQGTDGSDPIGIFFLFLAALMCAVYTVYSRKIGDAVDPLALVTIQQTAGCVWAALLFATTTRANVSQTLTTVPPAELGIAVLTGLMYYAAAYWLYLAALNRVSAALAGGSFNIIPIVTIAVAFVFLGERLTGLQLTGAALIIISAAALFWLSRERKPVKFEKA
ncbi:MAG: DMT family transporter [Aestuariivirga sp.]